MKLYLSCFLSENTQLWKPRWVGSHGTVKNGAWILMEGGQSGASLGKRLLGGKAGEHGSRKLREEKGLSETNTESVRWIRGHWCPQLDLFCGFVGSEASYPWGEEQTGGGAMEAISIIQPGGRTLAGKEEKSL